MASRRNCYSEAELEKDSVMTVIGKFLDEAERGGSGVLDDSP